MIKPGRLTACRVLKMSEYTDDIAEMIADWPVSYTIGAVTYTGTVATIDQGNDLTEGGFLDDVDAVLIGKKQDHLRRRRLVRKSRLAQPNIVSIELPQPRPTPLKCRFGLQHATQ